MSANAWFRKIEGIRVRNRDSAVVDTVTTLQAETDPVPFSDISVIEW